MGNWLQNLTQWLWEVISKLWDGLESLLGDLILSWIGHMMDLYALVIESIPAPEFLNQYSINNLLAAAGPSVAWVVGTFRIGEALALIGAGYAFRLLRKLLTLGQW